MLKHYKHVSVQLLHFSTSQLVRKQSCTKSTRASGVGACADLRQPGVRVDLEAVVVALPHLPAGVPHVVDPLLDALAVEIKYEEEDEAYKAQD